MKTYLYKKLTKAISKYFKTPQYLILYVTNDCWMKCKHCFYNTEFRQENKIDNDVLSLSELEKISKSIKKILYLSITGGEPFLRKDLVEIVKLFLKNSKVYRYQMPTSGFYTSLILEKTINILENNPSIPFRIHVSLDGNEEVHDKIRSKKGSFKSAIETIKELNKLKKSFSHFDVGIATTISNYNQDIIEEINDIVETVYPDGEWCINITRGKPSVSEICNVDPVKYSTAGEIISRRIKEGNFKGYSGHTTAKWLTAKNILRRKIIKRMLDNNYKGGGCSAGSLGGVIYPNGSVFPCELLNKSFGNIRDYYYNLNNLWNSSDAEKIRNYIQDSKCMCTQECNLSSNFLIQPNIWPALIKERIKLIEFKNNRNKSSIPNI